MQINKIKKAAAIAKAKTSDKRWVAAKARHRDKSDKPTVTGATKPG
jgi:hypothetical protein